MLCPYPFKLEVDGKEMLLACGKCRICRKLKSNEWAQRIMVHQETYPDSFFLTLTYDNPKQEIYSLSVRDLQLFFKRLRKAFPMYKITYFSCGEYGKRNERPHYHALVFGLPVRQLQIRKIHDKMYSEVLMHVWPEGFNNVGFVEKKSIRYVTGYIIKRMHNDEHIKKKNRSPEFGLYSKNLGLTAFIKNYDYYKRQYDKKKPLPRYFIKKIREIEEDQSGSLLNSVITEARKLVRLGKEDNMRDALVAIPRRNKQLEIDSLTLEKIYKQEGAL